ncbi:MAG: tripartite tricarboxylate transporter TctB family protein [Polaromonas sp.]|nr:tripartite tricarboxylate transporter TctB family protein [Polaromonas sp.]
MNSTLILGIASIIFALVFRSQTENFPDVAQRLPVLLIWLVVALGVMMIIEEVLKRRKVRNAAPGASIEQDEVLPPVNWFVLCSFGAAIVAYVALIPIMGYLIVTPVFVAGSLLVSRTLSPLKAILVGAVATAFVWAIFVWALNLPVQLLPLLN